MSTLRMTEALLTETREHIARLRNIDRDAMYHRDQTQRLLTEAARYLASLEEIAGVRSDEAVRDGLTIAEIRTRR